MADQVPTDPVLPSGLAAAYAQQQAQNQISSLQRQAMLSGQINDNFQSVLTSLSGLADQLGVSANPGAQKSTSTHRAPHMAPPTAPVIPRFREGHAPADPSSAPPSTNTSDVVRQYREGRQASMGSITKQIGGKVAGYLSQREPSTRAWSQQVADDGSISYVRTNALGEQTSIPQGSAGWRTAALRAGASTRARAVISGAAKAAATGDLSALGSLGGVASKLAGPVGLIVGTGMAARSQLESQNEKASFYRSALGQQGTGNFAAGQRLQESLASLSGWGTIGGDRAREEFRGATSMGLQGDRRNQATDFASQMYLKYGVDTAQSMQMVSTAISSGNVNLTQFAKNIGEVSEAAVKAGRSSADAIKDFNETLTDVGRNVTTGGGALAVTADLSKISDKMNTDLYSAVGGTKGLSHLLTDQNVQMIASLQGQNPLAALADIRDPSTSAAQAKKTLSGLADQVVQMVAQVLGMSADELKTRIHRATGGKSVSSANQWSIFKQIAGGDEQAGLASEAMTQVQGFYNFSISTAQALNLLFFQAMNGFKVKDKDEDLDGGSSIESAKYKRGDFTGNLRQITTGLGYSPYNSMGSKGGAAPGGASAAPALVQDYTKYVDKTGTQDKSIESLLNSSNLKQLQSAGGEDDISKIKFRVRSGGKTRDLTLAEILKNKSYVSQIDAGTADIVSSDGNDLTSVGDITRIRKTGASDSSGATQHKAVVELSPTARKILRFIEDSPSDSQKKGIPDPSTPIGSMFTFGAK